MFWSGMIVGVFVGAAVGILVMALAISASSDEVEEDKVHLPSQFSFESGAELVPDDDIHHKNDEIIE